MNLLDMPGPQFLGLYCWFLAAAVATALVLRWALRRPAHDPGIDPVDLDRYEVAYLAGRDKLAADAAIASLVQDGDLTFSAAEQKLLAAGSVPRGLHPVELCITHKS